MKINQVKHFVASNISKFERQAGLYGKSFNLYGKSFNLYDKNNIFRGIYCFIPVTHSSSLYCTQILDKNGKLQMEESIHINKDYITFEDKTSETLTKVLPKTITTTKTVIDYVKDRFLKVRTTSKLKNDLQRIKKNNPDFINSNNFVIYESLNKIPQYEKEVESISEGAISEVMKRYNCNTSAAAHYITIMDKLC